MANNRRGFSTRSNQKQNNWSSSMVGSHHSAGSVSRLDNQRPTSRRKRNSTLNGRIGEVSQVRPNVRNLDRRTASMNTNRSRTEEFMKRRRRNSILSVLIAAIVIVFVAFNLGSCAFKGSIASNMAINDSTLTSQLTSAKSDEPQYILLTAIGNQNQNNESMDYVAILRVDYTNNTLSLIDIPSNMAATSNTNTTVTYSSLSKTEGESSVLKHVIDKFGIKINHYLRISDSAFIDLMDSMGGLTINVTQRVDDPAAGSEVISTGTQTLKGNTLSTFLKASNFSNGFTTQEANQFAALDAFLKGMTSKSGFDYMSALDTFSNGVKTDMSLDDIEKIFNMYPSVANFYHNAAPITTSTSNGTTYSYLSSSKWNTMSTKFTNGENPSLAVDTSSVDKSALTIIVLNGSGIDGYAAQAANVLTAAGYTVQETGNAEQAVYDETLVIYKSNKEAAEAIVEDLGVGRAVSAGVYYSLTTEIQIMVGKDWKTKS